MSNTTKHLFKFRDYQKEIIDKGFKQCLDRRWCYLAMEVRTGKTLTSLGIASKIGGINKRVVFVTKKKAIPSVENDVKLINDKNMSVEVVNYESLHKLDFNKHIDVWVLDEAHKLGALGKPVKKTKQLKDMIHKYSSVIFLSGTPTPESNAQIFNQMYVLGEKSPFNGFTFFQWAKENCNIKEKYYGHGYPVKDYSDCFYDMSKLKMLTYSQKQAGFKNQIIEKFIEVKMKPITKEIISKIKKNKVYQGKEDAILADTPVKEMQKIHQLSSGCCILESGKNVIIDESKAIKIKELIKGRKVAIFYKFKGELEILKKHIELTESIEDFNNGVDVIALQFVSGREGVKLDKAEFIISMNIDFSAVTYQQFRDRMTTIDRKESHIYYIISDCGIEMEVYKAVSNKESYTKQYYERTTIPKQDNKEPRKKRLVRDKVNKDKQERNTRPNSNKAQQSLFS